MSEGNEVTACPDPPGAVRVREENGLSLQLTRPMEADASATRGHLLNQGGFDRRSIPVKMISGLLPLFSVSSSDNFLSEFETTCRGNFGHHHYYFE